MPSQQLTEIITISPQPSKSFEVVDDQVLDGRHAYPRSCWSADTTYAEVDTAFEGNGASWDSFHLGGLPRFAQDLSLEDSSTEEFPIAIVKARREIMTKAQAQTVQRQEYLLDLIYRDEDVSITDNAPSYIDVLSSTESGGDVSATDCDSEQHVIVCRGRSRLQKQDRRLGSDSDHYRTSLSSSSEIWRLSRSTQCDRASTRNSVENVPSLPQMEGLEFQSAAENRRKCEGQPCSKIVHLKDQDKLGRHRKARGIENCTLPITTQSPAGSAIVVERRSDGKTSFFHHSSLRRHNSTENFSRSRAQKGPTELIRADKAMYFQQENRKQLERRSKSQPRSCIPVPQIAFVPCLVAPTAGCTKSILPTVPAQGAPLDQPRKRIATGSLRRGCIVPETQRTVTRIGSKPTRKGLRGKLLGSIRKAL